MKKLAILLVVLASLNVYSQKGYVIPEVPDEMRISTEEFKAEINRIIVFFLNNKSLIPRNNVEFRFVDSFIGDSTKLGDTETNMAGNHKSHIVWLKVDSNKDRLIATLVHEYTHCVLNEQVNSPAYLPSNVEGVCEYLAYRYMERYYSGSWVINGHLNTPLNRYYLQLKPLIAAKPAIWRLILL